MSILTRPALEATRLLLTSRQAAEALAISERHLAELRRRGELTPIRIPGRGRARSVRYLLADLREWIEKQKTETPSLSDGCKPFSGRS
jgi:hypothetical protein